MDKTGYLAPLLVFLLLVVVLALGFGLKDPHLLPSELIDRPFPSFELSELNNSKPSLTEQDLKGEVSLVNVWATWCPACVVEHPVLVELGRKNAVRLIGVNYKDDPVKARVWLQQKQDPYDFIIVDQDGRLGIDLGVYGAPETFLVDADGVIQHKFVGAVTMDVWKSEFEPLVEFLRKKKIRDNSVILNDSSGDNP